MKLNENDIITTDGYFEFYKKNSKNLSYIKTDYFYNGKFYWRGELHPNDIKKNVIIGHSDYPVNDNITFKFKKVFCINNQSINKNTFSLPLGIPNNNNELEILKIIGNKKVFYNVMNEKFDKENLLYMNFSKNTQLNLRSHLFEYFRNFSWVTHETPKINELGWLNYLRNIKKSKFILCPKGNGDDTHRLWESLYLGSIPIIQNLKTHDICHDLPVLFVDDWNLITKEFLDKKYDEIISKTYNLEKLKISYWENLIKSMINDEHEI